MRNITCSALNHRLEKAEFADFSKAVGITAAKCDTDAAKQGGKVGEMRIVKANDGWALERLEAMTNGTAKWTRLYFSRNKVEVEKAKARRS